MCKNLEACYAYAPSNSSTPSIPQHHFFNCAAPKSQLQQSCHAMRQVQQQYPPYPHHVGVHQIHPPPGVPFRAPATTQTTLAVKKPEVSRVRRNPLGNKRSTPSILKHYKSCPVSPVHEEVEWIVDNHNVIITEPKRHSVYAEDARTILNMIHADTEKMITEITKKYGDLNDMSLDVNHQGVSRPLHIPSDLSSTTVSSGADTPKRSISEYYIYQEVYKRKVSLSDILQDNPEQIEHARRVAEARFLETQRHSSASFFLTSPFAVNSQESLLSDELHDESGSYCNSLESILSDESDCKSAPMENPLENRSTNLPRHTELRNFIIHGGPMSLVSKSYGNSPNTYGSFDYYMQQRQLQPQNYSPLPYESMDVSNYSLEQLKLPNSHTYPRLQAISAGKMEDIPSLSCKNKQYNATVNKSLSQDFHTKPLFVRKELKSKPPVPLKPMNLVSNLTNKVESNRRTASVVRKYEHNLQKFEREKQSVQQQQQQIRRIRASSSSGALTTGTHSCLKKVSKFDAPTDEKNARRATSVRIRPRPKISVRFNTVSQIKYTPSEKRSQVTTTTCPLNDINCNATSRQLSEGEVKTFEMFIAENGNNEFVENMDALKLYTKPEMQAVVDEIKQQQLQSRERDTKLLKNAKNTHHTAKTATQDTDIVDAKTNEDTISTTHQCLNIAQKIDIIEKLIAMEERKMEQLRLATESRMRPFACNSQQKGYVKSLTMNFDMLAKGIEKEKMLENNNLNQQTTNSKIRIKRNVSLPDVLESADVHSYMFQPRDDVEMGKEVKTDSDVVEEHDSEKIRLDCHESAEGTPKSLLPMPIEENSIRRACSLSDLYMGNTNKGGKSPAGNVQKNSRNNSVTRVSNKRNSLQLKNSSGSLLAVPSPSLGVLNQGSDSETEEADRNNRLGSTNQARSNGPIAANRSYNNKTTNTNSNRRKGLQTSFTNATPQDDSSSEETPSNNNPNNKPVVPPRPRNLTFDHKSKFLNNSVTKQRTSSNEINEFEQGDAQSQVHNVINKLYTTTQTVMQLHENLKNCEDSLMLKELENAVIMTQNMLTNITQNNSEKNVTNMVLSGSNSNNNTNNEQTNVDNGEYVKMVNNCADLLSNFRWKHKTDDCEQNS